MATSIAAGSMAQSIAQRAVAGRALTTPAVQQALRGELGAAALRYAPKFGAMGADDVARGRELVRSALDDLQLVPVVNRWHRPGVPITEAPDALMGTVHTMPPRHNGDRLNRLVRHAWERHNHMHGPGPLAGSTVFASGQFVPRSRIAAQGGDVLAALDEVAAARGGWGVARFGDRAHVLDQSVLARTTVSGRDSGIGPTAARISTTDRMTDVVLERLARSHGFRHDPFTGANEYRWGIDGVASAAERRASWRALLDEAPSPQATDRLRSYLTGPAMTDIDHMLELQVRGVRGRDIIATRVETAAAHVQPVTR